MSDKQRQKRQADKKKRREKRKGGGGGGTVVRYTDQPGLLDGMPEDVKAAAHLMFGMGMPTRRKPPKVTRLTLKPDQAMRLRVRLRYTDPVIWRQVEVPTDIPLDELAEVILAAMPWDGWEHLHEFRIGKASFATHPGMLDQRSPLMEPVLDGADYALGEVVARVGQRFEFEYDFGDSWIHDIDVEAIDPIDPAVTLPRVIAGERAAPPEDIGGISGFEDLLAELEERAGSVPVPAQAQPEGADEDEEGWALEVDWSTYDPAAFDLEEANQRVQRTD